MFAAARQRLAGVARSVGPSLRVVGLTYTGLLGILSLVAVIGVALSPVSPTLQQVTEPARQAVSEYVQPTSEFVTTIIGAAPLHVVVSPPLSETKSVAVMVAGETDLSLDEDTPVTEEPFESSEPLAETSVPVVAAPVFGPSPVAYAPGPVDDTSPAEVDEVSSEEPAQDAEPEDMPGETVLPMIVQPADTSGLLIATEQAPQPLPTVQPETAAQIKARLEAENAAAIAAARDARAKAKAEADLANQAAIDALKGASAAATAVARGASAPTALPTPQPTATPVPELPLHAAPAVSVPTQPTQQAQVKQSSPPAPVHTAAPTATLTLTGKAAADAANQAAIDAARSARSKARTEAEAANEAAIAAAHPGKTGATAAMPKPKGSPEPVATRTAVDAVAIDAPVAQELDTPEPVSADVVAPEASLPETAAPEPVVAQSAADTVAESPSFDDAQAD